MKHIALCSALLFVACSSEGLIDDPIDEDPDFDWDGVPDMLDNCPADRNADQANHDPDERGDACDEDDDNDGCHDAIDNCWVVPNPEQEDRDRDFIGDACDPVDDPLPTPPIEDGPVTVPPGVCGGDWLLTRAESVAEVPRSNVIRGVLDALYWYGADGKRYVFPNLNTFRTWYPGDAPCPVIYVLADELLVTIPLGPGNVTYRPGTRLIKIFSDPAVYAIAHGGVIRRFANESAPIALFGTGWTRLLDDLPDAFFSNYRPGMDISTATDYDPEAERVRSPTIDHDLGLR